MMLNRQAETSNPAVAPGRIGEGSETLAGPANPA
jgi:hypothetical protein